MQVSGGGDDYGHFVSLQSGSTFGEDILINEPNIIWCSYPDLQCSFLERHYVAFPYLVSLGNGCGNVQAGRRLCQEALL